MVESGPSALSRWMRPVNMILTFVMVSLTFMFFRAPSMDDVAMMWHQILFDFHLSVAPQFVESYLTHSPADDRRVYDSTSRPHG